MYAKTIVKKKYPYAKSERNVSGISAYHQEVYWIIREDTIPWFLGLGKTEYEAWEDAMKFLEQ